MKDAAFCSYRCLSTRLYDDPWYQRELSADAKLVYLTLRGCQQRGVAGLYRFYPEVLQTQVHPLTRERVLAALEDLQAAELVKWDRDAGVLWIVHALGEDRSVTLSYEKHRVGILRALNDLPATKLKDDFIQHYHLEIENAE
jgi:hypothetical protein